MEKKTIEINGVKIELRFDFYTLKLLSKKWSLKTVNEVINKIIVNASGVSPENLSFDSIEIFADMLSVLDDKNEIDDRSINNYLFEHPDIIVEIVQLFMDSLSVPDKTEKKKNQK